MVYIPWDQMGICKFWMLKRCFQGDACRWRHPDPEERRMLWDYHTAKQIEDEQQYGIPRPRKPERGVRARRVEGGEGGVGTSFNGSGTAEAQGFLPPPEPAYHPPLPPLDFYGSSRSATLGYGDIDDDRYPRQSRPSFGQYRDSFEPRPYTPPMLGRYPVIDDRRAADVSVLDAPPSPKHDREDTMTPSNNANAEPLGRPNRLLERLGSDTSQRPGFQQLPGVQNTQFNAREAPYRGLGGFGDAFSPDVPSSAAVSVWKRSEHDFTDELPLIDSKGPSPQEGSYWERKRKQKAAGEMNRVEDATAGEQQTSKVLGGTKNPNPFDTPEINIAPPSSPPSIGITPQAMGATKRLSNGESKHVGPHPSTIRVSARYLSQAAITKKLQQVTSQSQLDAQERSIAEAREDTIRLQGVGWIDNVRRSLQLPIKTFSTACVYFHKFRLAYAGGVNGVDYSNAWPDACAAALLTACKVEDTLKKSRDILAAAYNLKANTHDQLGADDAVFEGPSRVVIGLERLVLEAGGFDFRSKYPHQLLLKIAKSLPAGEAEDGQAEKKEVGKLAWTVLTDLHRTLAPLKQTSQTMAIACLELASHLQASSTPNNTSASLTAVQQLNLQKWSTSREEIMETLLDLLDLYTQHTSQTILGPKYSLDDFLRTRLALNKECNESNIPRYTAAPPSDRNGNGNAANGSTLRVANGHPTPVSPMEPGPQPAQAQQNSNSTQNAPEGGGTLRFMLNPELAADEKAQVQKYFAEEWEEYEEEVEIPQPRLPSRDREPNRDRERERPRDRDRDRVPRDGPPPPPRADRGDRETGRPREDRDRDRERDRARDREREAERERARARDIERDRRYGGSRDGRFDDRKERRGYEDRRYEDERRRRR